MSNDERPPEIWELEEMLRRCSEPAMIWGLKYALRQAKLAKMTPEQLEAFKREVDERRAAFIVDPTTFFDNKYSEYKARAERIKGKKQRQGKVIKTNDSQIRW